MNHLTMALTTASIEGVKIEPYSIISTIALPVCIVALLVMIISLIGIGMSMEEETGLLYIGLIAGVIGIVALTMLIFSDKSVYNNNLQALNQEYSTEILIEDKLDLRSTNPSYLMKDVPFTIDSSNLANLESGIVRIKGDTAVLLVPVDEKSELPEYVEYGQ